MRIDYDIAAEAAEKARAKSTGIAMQIANKVCLALRDGRKIKRLILRPEEHLALLHLNMVAGNHVHLPSGAGSFHFAVEPEDKGDAS